MLWIYHYFINDLLTTYRLLQPDVEVLVECSQLRFRARSRSDALHAGDVILDEGES